MMILRACLLLLLGASAAWAASPPFSTGSAAFQTIAQTPVPNANLPAHVQAPPGKLTLFADFAHADAQGVPLYLVNRTPAPVTFAAESRDLRLKLERQLPDGAWQRVQAHEHSGACVSETQPTLQPGMHFQMRGYQPAQGQTATVRYTSYLDVPISSNAGPGRFSPTDAQDAAQDPLTLRALPRCIVDALRISDTTLSPPATVAITLTPSQRLAAIHAATLLGEMSWTRNQAEHWLHQIKTAAHPDSAEAKILPPLQNLLAADWGPRTKSLEPLLKTCLAALKASTSTNTDTNTNTSPTAPANSHTDHDPLAAEPAFTARLVADIARLEFETDDTWPGPPSDLTLWREVVMRALTISAKPSSSPESPIRSVLSIPFLADEFVSDTLLEPLLEKDTYAHWMLAALTRRRQWDRLAELGFKLHPEQQLQILDQLAGNPHHPQTQLWATLRRPEPNSPEERFWAHVIQTQPAAAGATLYMKLAIADESENPYRGPLFEPIRHHWRLKAEHSARQNQDFEEPHQPDQQDRLSLEFIAATAHRDDIPLLNSLLGYRGYHKTPSPHPRESSPAPSPDPNSNTSAASSEDRTFTTRLIAAKALRHLNHPIPPTPVTD